MSSHASSDQDIKMEDVHHPQYPDLKVKIAYMEEEPGGLGLYSVEHEQMVIPFDLDNIAINPVFSLLSNPAWFVRKRDGVVKVIEIDDLGIPITLVNQGLPQGAPAYVISPNIFLMDNKHHVGNPFTLFRTQPREGYDLKTALLKHEDDCTDWIFKGVMKAPGDGFNIVFCRKRYVLKMGGNKEPSAEFAMYMFGKDLSNPVFQIIDDGSR